MATYAEVSSHLIDQLRAAHATATSLAALGDGAEKDFAEGVVSHLERLLDDLGCYD